MEQKQQSSITSVNSVIYLVSPAVQTLFDFYDQNAEGADRLWSERLLTWEQQFSGSEFCIIVWAAFLQTTGEQNKGTRCTTCLVRMFHPEKWPFTELQFFTLLEKVQRSGRGHLVFYLRCEDRRLGDMERHQRVNVKRFVFVWFSIAMTILTCRIYGSAITLWYLRSHWTSAWPRCRLSGQVCTDLTSSFHWSS